MPLKRPVLRDPAPHQTEATLACQPAAVDVLAATLNGSAPRSVQNAALLALASDGSAAAVAALAACLRKPDAWLRNSAIDVLRTMPMQVASIIAELLGDADADVRILAISMLDTLPHPDIEAWLLDLLAREEDVNVCGAALDVLAGVAGQASRPALLELQQRFANVPFITFAAALVLERIACPHVEPTHA